MVNPLVQRLSHFAALSPEEARAVESAVAKVKTLDPHQDIIHRGDIRSFVTALLEGYACRYTTMPEGGRQITAILLPGDFCNLSLFLRRRMDQNVSTFTACTVAEIPHAAIFGLMEAHPRIVRALWWSTLVDEAILREWAIGLGRRSALQRMAHLLCEMLVRLQAAGLAVDHSCRLPLTQADLSDVLGLSTVHTNRILQELRRHDLIVLKGDALAITDWEGLQELCEFNRSYLDPDRS